MSSEIVSNVTIEKVLKQWRELPAVSNGHGTSHPAKVLASHYKDMIFSIFKTGLPSGIQNLTVEQIMLIWYMSRYGIVVYRNPNSDDWYADAPFLSDDGLMSLYDEDLAEFEEIFKTLIKTYRMSEFYDFGIKVCIVTGDYNRDRWSEAMNTNVSFTIPVYYILSEDAALYEYLTRINSTIGRESYAAKGLKWFLVNVLCAI